MKCHQSQCRLGKLLQRLQGSTATSPFCTFSGSKCRCTSKPDTASLSAQIVDHRKFSSAFTAFWCGDCINPHDKIDGSDRKVNAGEIVFSSMSLKALITFYTRVHAALARASVIDYFRVPCASKQTPVSKTRNSLQQGRLEQIPVGYKSESLSLRAEIDPPDLSCVLSLCVQLFSQWYLKYLVFLFLVFLICINYTKPHWQCPYDVMMQFLLCL